MKRFTTRLAEFDAPGSKLALFILVGVISVAVSGLLGDTAKPAVLIGGCVAALLIGAVMNAMAAPEQRRRKAQIFIEGDTWEQVFANAGEAILLSDASGRILRINPAFGRLTGYTAREVVGKTPRLLHSERHSAAFYDAIARQLDAVGFWQGGAWQRRKDGSEFFGMLSLFAIKGRDGNIHRYVHLLRDVTEQRQRSDDFAQFAYQDILTGLPNRYLLHDRLAQAVEVARRERDTLALMFIDLDRFKIVNDSLGYEVGDLLLIETANRFRSLLGPSATLARLGGDEFVVLLPDAGSIGNVSDLAEEFNRCMEPPMQVMGRDIHLGASIGIALFPRDGENAMALMKNADTAMYRSKAEGPNGYRFFDLAMNASAAERMEMESALRRALQCNEFVMHYQPKIDLRSGRVAGAEALIRWQDPEHGQISPGQFIPLAEETGLITKIGDWALDEVCRQMADWQARGILPQQVGVNVSARQFLDEYFAEKVILLLEKYKLPHASLELELTESTVMANPEAAARQMRRLQAAGVGISLDDFGTGYSSLTYLKRLPISVIKMDKSFIHKLDADEDNAAIVSAIQGMADALGMSTLAEGIERKDEASHLQASGCDFGQGFFYSPPLPVHEFEQWMGQRPGSDKGGRD